MKKFILALLISLTFGPLAIGQSRSPAVEPVRGLSIDREPEYKNHPGFNFKNGQPVSTTDTSTGTGVYAVLFMLSLASVPFLMHVIFKGNVVPTATTENVTNEEGQNTVSLEEFREKKSDSEEAPEDIKKAG